jgi:hypothetical protein
MRRLPVLFFAAAIAIWGLASIPDGSSGEKPLQVSEPDPKASGADDSGVIHGFRDNSEALIRDVDASA